MLGPAIITRKNEIVAPREPYAPAEIMTSLRFSGHGRMVVS